MKRKRKLWQKAAAQLALVQGFYSKIKIYIVRQEQKLLATINSLEIIEQIQHQLNRITMTSKNQESAFELQDFSEEQSLQNNAIQIRNQRKAYDGCSQGPWKMQQNLSYVIFMDINQVIFCSKSKRKYSKIFTNLAAQLKTRNASQCRSHFQKLMARHKTLKNIFKFYKTQVGEDVYRKKYFQFQKDLANSEAKSETNEQSKQKECADKAIQTDDMKIQKDIHPNIFPCFNQQWLYHNFYGSQEHFLIMNDAMRRALGI